MSSRQLWKKYNPKCKLKKKSENLNLHSQLFQDVPNNVRQWDNNKITRIKKAVIEEKMLHNFTSSSFFFRWRANPKAARIKNNTVNFKWPFGSKNHVPRKYSVGPTSELQSQTTVERIGHHFDLIEVFNRPSFNINEELQEPLPTTTVESSTIKRLHIYHRSEYSINQYYRNSPKLALEMSKAIFLRHIVVTKT